MNSGSTTVVQQILIRLQASYSTIAGKFHRDKLAAGNLALEGQAMPLATSGEPPPWGSSIIALFQPGGLIKPLTLAPILHCQSKQVRHPKALSCFR